MYAMCIYKYNHIYYIDCIVLYRINESTALSEQNEAKEQVLQLWQWAGSLQRSGFRICGLGV